MYCSKNSEATCQMFFKNIYEGKIYYKLEQEVLVE